MTTYEDFKNTAQGDEPKFATFYVGETLMGIEIRQVEEINRLLEVTPVPQAPPYVRGVINLRGEVVTVIDLRQMLGLPAAVAARDSRNVIVDSHGERIGLMVDRVADVVETSADAIDRPPPNLSGVDGRFFAGVCQLATGLLVLLDVEAVLATDTAGVR